jgi:uncharacterized membrane protein
LLIGSKWMFVALGISWAVAHVSGLDDEITPHSATAWAFVAALTLIVLVLSHIAYVRLRSDDELMGEAIVPLKMLMDQRKHTLQVSLRAPKDEGHYTHAFHERRNEFGRLGIIRMRLWMSER